MKEILKLRKISKTQRVFGMLRNLQISDISKLKDYHNINITFTIHLAHTYFRATKTHLVFIRVLGTENIHTFCI